MNPAVIWLISQLIGQTVNRLQQTGKYDTLSQAEAEDELQRVAASLSTNLPTPEDLINKGENDPNV